VNIRLTAFAVMATLVILCASLTAFSQAPPDRGFLAGKKYDMNGPHRVWRTAIRIWAACGIGRVFKRHQVL